MKKIGFILMLLTLFLVAGCGAGGTTGALTGVVQDENGNLLEGVRMVFESEEEYRVVFSTVEGKYEVENLAKETYTLILDRDGCETYTDEYKVGSGEEIVDFLMSCPPVAVVN